MGTSTGRVRDPVTGRPGDQMIGRSWGRPRDVGHICFLNSTQKHVKLTLNYLKVTQVNYYSAKFSYHYSNLNFKN